MARLAQRPATTQMNNLRHLSSKPLFRLGTDVNMLARSARTVARCARVAVRTVPPAARPMGTISKTLDSLAESLPDKEALQYPIQVRVRFAALGRAPPRVSLWRTREMIRARGGAKRRPRRRTRARPRRCPRLP